jgi:glyoxylase-like metal-dependent hydrolase (beta-lactamase superfamily II)
MTGNIEQLRDVLWIKVILTHGHWDHVLGAVAFPNAPVIS